jgi:hypothetical protein
MKTFRYWLAAAALLLTGCTSVVTGAASVDQAELKQYQEDHAPLTAQRALGDVTTVDYCSLLDLNRARQAGATGVGWTSTSFNYCFVTANVGSASAEIGVGYLEGAIQDSTRIPDPTKDLTRGLVAQRNVDGDSSTCARYLRFADGLDLEIYVDDVSGSTTSDSTSLCAVEDAVFDGLVDTIMADKTAHLTFPPGTLGTVDACSLASDAQIAEQLGESAPKTPSIPTKHRCRWQSATSKDALTIFFDAGKPPTSATETLAGRQASIEGGDGLRYCLATTAIAPFPGASNGDYQLAQVYVFNRGGVKDACATVRAVANVVWPKLPSS